MLRRFRRARHSVRCLLRRLEALLEDAGSNTTEISAFDRGIRSFLWTAFILPMLTFGGIGLEFAFLLTGRQQMTAQGANDLPPEDDAGEGGRLSHAQAEGPEAPQASGPRET